MILLQEQNSSNWTDVEFLKSANKQLVECRKVLKYSYTFAFYLEEGDKKTRFEYHQEMLERFTEHLSELSEKPIQEMNRTDVVNSTRKVRVCVLFSVLSCKFWFQCKFSVAWLLL